MAVACYANDPRTNQQPLPCIHCHTFSPKAVVDYRQGTVTNTCCGYVTSERIVVCPFGNTSRRPEQRLDYRRNNYAKRDVGTRARVSVKCIALIDRICDARQGWAGVRLPARRIAVDYANAVQGKKYNTRKRKKPVLLNKAPLIASAALIHGSRLNGFPKTFREIAAIRCLALRQSEVARATKNVAALLKLETLPPTVEDVIRRMLCMYYAEAYNRRDKKQQRMMRFCVDLAKAIRAQRVAVSKNLYSLTSAIIFIALVVLDGLDWADTPTLRKMVRAVSKAVGIAQNTTVKTLVLMLEHPTFRPPTKRIDASTWQGLRKCLWAWR